MKLIHQLVGQLIGQFVFWLIGQFVCQQHVSLIAFPPVPSTPPTFLTRPRPPRAAPAPLPRRSHSLLLLFLLFLLCPGRSRHSRRDSVFLIQTFFSHLSKKLLSLAKKTFCHQLKVFSGHQPKKFLVTSQIFFVIS